MKFNEDKAPATVDEAIETIVAGLTAEERGVIANSTPASFHFSFGRFIRNSWGMWEDSPLRRDFIKRTGLFSHGDDISCLILEMVFAKVRDEDFNEVQWVDKIKAHWRKYNLDPATGQKV